MQSKSSWLNIHEVWNWKIDIKVFFMWLYLEDLHCTLVLQNHSWYDGEDRNFQYQKSKHLTPQNFNKTSLLNKTTFELDSQLISLHDKHECLDAVYKGWNKPIQKHSVCAHTLSTVKMKERKKQTNRSKKI